MQIAPDQGALLTLLARTIGASSALELGTFTGYSALCIARGLAPGGRLLCCDVSEEWTAIARRYWAEAGVEGRIELRLGPALATLRALPPTRSFDYVFLDADKPTYPDYWEEIVPRVQPGGLILVDNVLRYGTVWDPSDSDEGTELIRAFNDKVAADRRVESVILPVADGLTVARRREEWTS
jgi:caffeoyl-CoA O-methyltransferase